MSDLDRRSCAHQKWESDPITDSCTEGGLAPELGTQGRWHGVMPTPIQGAGHSAATTPGSFYQVLGRGRCSVRGTAVGYCGEVEPVCSHKGVPVPSQSTLHQRFPSLMFQGPVAPSLPFEDSPFPLCFLKIFLLPSPPL